MKPTITLDQAKKQIDTYLADILTKLPVKPTATSGSFSDLECDHNDAGPHGRKETSRGYDFGDVPLANKTEATDAFRTFLTGEGFQPVPEGAGSHSEWVRLKNPKDNFLAVFDGTSGASHNLSLTVVSPCVWPDGNPPT
ncbi:hypothetical protein ACFXDE_30405 [Kitasatospora sp. NPDC059408]|uniref:hypothetical protein n=1 Tax=Kitasatospora sp. NPDC059408 TaxID=3346823 RepID=UPI0036BA6E36